MKRLIIVSALGIVILTLLLIRLFSGSGSKPAGTAATLNPVVPVEVFIARDTSVIYEISTPGTLVANESVEIVSEISKKVSAVFLKEGEEVSKGTLLFKLDDADIQAIIGKLMIAEELAATNESRQKVQLDQGGISREQYDATLNHLLTIRAELAIQRVELAKTEIRAPFSGRIGLRFVSPGAYVTPGTVLASLQDVSRIKVDFSVSERYAGDVRQGGTITFTTDYLPEVYSATIAAIEPKVNEKTRTVSLRAVCPNEHRLLVPGTFAQVALDLKAFDKKLFVPSSALIPSVTGYKVYLVRSGKAKLQPVKTGIRNRSSVEITEGLDPGDTTVTTNLLRLKPDSPLRMVKYN